MNTPQSYSFPRYLASKKSIDDRALNRAVWHALASRLPADSSEQPLRVLEVGAGIGTMIERVLEWGLLPGPAHYTALDARPDNIQQAGDRLPAWGQAQGWQIEVCPPSGWRFERSGQQITIATETIDLFDFITREAGTHPWDLLIAHAFLDLMDIPFTLPQLFRLLRPGGLFYFTLNFDGVTVLEPAIDPLLDGQIESLYHQTMDERLTRGRSSGDSRTGRHLFSRLVDAGAQILAAGSSDWVVFPHSEGTQPGYPEDEAYFLHFILHTIGQALAGHPKLDSRRFAGWLAQRHNQVERGELVYIAHQLDFAGTIP